MFGGTIREKSKVLHFVEIASFDHHEAQAIAISVGLLVYVVEVSGDTCQSIGNNPLFFMAAYKKLSFSIQPK